MAEMSRRFNFDDFDEQIAEALAEYGEIADSLRPALEPLPFGEKRPGEIGGVVVQLALWPKDAPTFWDEPEPPEAA